MLTAIIVGFLVILVYFAYFYQDRRAKKLLDKIPGPPYLPIIGNAHELRLGNAFFKQILEWTDQYGKEGLVRLWLAPRPLVGIFKAPYIEALLSSSKHIDKSFNYRFLHPWLGTGLLTSTGDKWRVRRKQLTPTFHFNILLDFLSVFNKQADVLVKKLEGKAGNGRFDLFQDIALNALDNICETAMGISVDAQKSDSEYVKAVYKMSELTDKRSKNPLYWNNFMYNLIGDGREYSKNLKILHDFTRNVINDRLKDFDDKKAQIIGNELKGDGSQMGKKVRLAFLDMLLYLSDNLTKLSIENIMEEVDTFMFEGHDTTAAAMNWTTHLIGANPDVQTKVHEEMDKVFGSDRKREITSDDLKELKYLENCIKEGLRLFPSVPVFAREIVEDMQLGKYTIPKGTTLIAMPLALHRDPEVFPNPNEFNPDRFTLENSKGRHPYSYVPFSAGPRNCIGQKFAMMEQKVTLAYLFRRFEVKSLQTREELFPCPDIILRPETGIDVELKLRN